MDFAPLGIRIDSSEAVGATADLRDFKISAQTAEQAVEALEQATEQLSPTLDRAGGAAGGAASDFFTFGTASDYLIGSQRALAGSTDAAAREIIDLTTAARHSDAAMQQLAEASAMASAEELQLSIAAIKAAKANNTLEMSTEEATQAIRIMNAAMQQSQKAISATNRRMGLMAFQLNDVGVSLASGMNPLMVFVQQGAQIGQMYGTGTGGAATALSDLKTMATSAIGALAPMAPVLLGIGAAIAATTVVVGGLTASINETTDESVTMGDTMAAIGELAVEAISDTVAPAFEALAPVVSSVWQFIQTSTATLINWFVRGWSIQVENVKTLFNGLGIAIGGSINNLLVEFSEPIEAFIGDIIDDVNTLIRALNSIVGTDFSEIPFEGFDVQARNITAELQALGSEYLNTVETINNTDYAGDALGAIGERAVARARARRIEEEADEREEASRAAERAARELQRLEDQLAARQEANYVARLQSEGQLIDLAEYRLNREIEQINELAEQTIAAGANAAEVEATRAQSIADARISTENTIADIRQREAQEEADRLQASTDARIQAEQQVQDFREALRQQGVITADISASPFPDEAKAFGVEDQIADEMRREEERLARLDAVYADLIATYAGNEEEITRLLQEQEDARAAIREAGTEEQGEIIANGQATIVATFSAGLSKMTQTLEQALGEGNDLYKAFLVAESVAKMTQAAMNIQVAISQAMTLPFPANIPAIAAAVSQGAQIISTMSQLQSAFGGGRERGGTT
ncbi:MAG: phage tail length tape measure family protein, partial [Pseudomonadota bacterium]|nr:phage tail length tape measure family protein [Pseudomonadota bacterium]